MSIFQLFFSVQGTDGSSTGLDPENRVGDQAQVDQFLVGCKCPVRRGIFVQEQDHIGEIPAVILLQNVLEMHQLR
jgi:hypothetical protein